MNKKTVSTLLLSTVLLSQFFTVIPSVHAGVLQSENNLEKQSQKVEQLTDKQLEATKQLEEVQAKVTALESEQSNLETENEHLESVSKTLEQEIDTLSKNIVSRQSSLEEQARSAQTKGTALDYVNAVVNSKSISDAISKVSAMNQIVEASNKMLTEQKKDKEDILAKQEENNNAINTVIANKEKLQDDAQSLNARKAELEVAKLNLEVEKTEAEDKKAELLAQKEELERKATQALEEEKTYLAQKESDKVNLTSSTNTSLEKEVTAVSAPTWTPSEESLTVSEVVEEVVTPTPVSTYTVAKPRYNTNASSYPTGQCTWGAKTLCPWAGDYWGNGGQWAASARAAGFRTGSTPQVGAIASWDDGGYGHVAVVTAVESATRIQVSEANYDGSGTQPIGNYRGWFNPLNSRGTVTYIYPN